EVAPVRAEGHVECMALMPPEPAGGLAGGQVPETEGTIPAPRGQQSARGVEDGSGVLLPVARWGMEDSDAPAGGQIQRWIVSSRVTVASWLPPGCQATELTIPAAEFMGPCRSTAVCLSAVTSQSRTVPSHAEEAMRLPSGLKATS